MSLPYQPKLSLKLPGGVKRRGHPAIKAVFTAKPGEANSRAVQVSLPKGELLDNAHIGTICTRPQFASDSCPEASSIGSAEARRRCSTRRSRAPSTCAPRTTSSPTWSWISRARSTSSSPARIDTSKGGALRTTFESVPDVPVSQFVLNLAGGAKGLLQNSESLCGKPKKATVKTTGQNGAVVTSQTKLQVACGKKKARHKRHGKRHSDARKAG